MLLDRDVPPPQPLAAVPGRESPPAKMDDECDLAAMARLTRNENVSAKRR
jgi:hypothetical protein